MTGLSPEQIARSSRRALVEMWDEESVGMDLHHKTIISREDFRHLGQAIADMDCRTPKDYEFAMMDTQQIHIGKGASVEAGGKTWTDGIYVVAPGEWY